MKDNHRDICLYGIIFPIEGHRVYHPYYMSFLISHNTFRLKFV